MLFNSLHFLIFYPIVVLLYFILPHRFRWFLLLSSSYYFYMAWKPEYAVLLVISTLIDYFAGIRMGNTENQFKRRLYLALSLMSNLGLLFTFKYYNFFNDALLGFSNGQLGFSSFNLLLPMGISFYTFQTMSYSIDVYRGTTKPVHHLGIFALYVTFFPQLVAGPIERSDRLLPQFYDVHTFDYDRITNGLKKMAWGFFKKIVIADRLAVIVNLVYNNPTDFGGIPLLVSTVFFAFQIYCDFSGYSDIAIGSAEVMGFKLMENFNRPYYSKSITEFWKRWHISLSTWFRDYVYIPLGGSRVRLSRTLINLMITFVISGIWHGANWTFLVWGFVHGLFLIIEKLISPNWPKSKVIATIRMFWTFTMVNFAWIFFRANTLTDALFIIKTIVNDIGGVFSISSWVQAIASMGLTTIDIATIFVSLATLEGIHLLQRRGSVRQQIMKFPVGIRIFLYALFVTLILYLRYIGARQFIYFQF